MNKKNIIFIKILPSSFINIDEQILSERYNVKTFKLKKVKGFSIFSEFIREFFFMLRNVWNTDIIYIWFADFHAVIPTLIGRLFGKKVVIVLGGVDASYIKELNYGVKSRLLGRVSLYISTRMATHLLPVTQFTYGEMLKNVGAKLKTKSHIIYNCFNDIFQCNSSVERKDNVVTVCMSARKKTVFIKGVDFYLEVAKTLPNVNFFVVGIEGEAKEYLKSLAPVNVILWPKIPQVKLKELFCSSKVVCQFSRHEAFGVALIEGISAGCYPVGYNYAGTKEIITEGLGILIDKLDVDQGKRAIEEALTKTATDIEPIKKSVTERFSINRRRYELLSYIDSIK